MDALFELNVAAPGKPSRDVSSTLHRELRSAILQGRIRPGAKLPSTRRARFIFGASRNTVQEVYERLAEEGLTTARHGSGTYVAEPLPAVAIPSPGSLSAGPDRRLNKLWLRLETRASLNFWHETKNNSLANQAPIDLRPSLVDPKFFPFATFRKVVARELRRMEMQPLSLRSPPSNQGNPLFRSAIADHIALTRAVACRGDDILVTSGAQQAWDLIAKILVKAGETVVAVEDPGYPPMRVPFEAAGARIAPVRVDREGLVVAELPPRASIICVCPSHQFPLGMSMSPARRGQLIDFAQRNHAVVLEDDYDGEFRYDGSPLEALRGAASADVVFYVGTFSKCMLPALRLGFVVAPPWAMTALVTAKNSLDWYSSLPLQLAVAAFIKDGHLARHIQQIRRTYAQRRDHLLMLLEEHLKGDLEPIVPTYGMHFTAVARSGIDAETASRKLAARGILCHTLSRYFLGPADRTGFVMGYASANINQLSETVSALTEELSAPGTAKFRGIA